MKATILSTTILAVALSLGVCRADDKTLGEKTSDALETAKDKTVEAGQAVVNETKKAVETVKDAVTPSADARKVEVTLTNNHIEMPRDVSPGKTAFIVHNNGRIRQNFKIEGPGVDKSFFLAIEPNDSKTLELDLKPGDYKVFVPGKENESKGDEIGLRVK